MTLCVPLKDIFVTSSTRLTHVCQKLQQSCSKFTEQSFLFCVCDSAAQLEFQTSALFTLRVYSHMFSLLTLLKHSRTEVNLMTKNLQISCFYSERWMLHLSVPFLSSVHTEQLPVKGGVSQNAAIARLY